MSIQTAIEGAYQLFEIPNRIKRENAREDRKELNEESLQTQQKMLEFINRHNRNQNLQIRELAPEVERLKETAKQNEFNRSEIARRGQTGDTIAVVDAALEGRGRLEDRLASNKLTAQEQQRRAIHRALELAALHDENITRRFIGDEPMVPQYLNTAREMQTEQMGLMRELAQMNQPTGFERFANTVSRAVSNIGPVALAAYRTFS
jgi:hypothetical protein